MCECLGGKPLRAEKSRLPELIFSAGQAERRASWPAPSKSTHAGTRKVVNYAC